MLRCTILECLHMPDTNQPDQTKSQDLPSFSADGAAMTAVVPGKPREVPVEENATPVAETDKAD
jgi:hypothetical protein